MWSDLAYGHAFTASPISISISALLPTKKGMRPGPPATYDDRLDVMSRHFHVLVAQRGERFASLTFRKVANWYCKVLRPGRDIQPRLMQLERVADFDSMVARLRDRRPDARFGEEPAIPVPRGPVERW